MLVALVCGSWCASALAMKCQTDWYLLLIDYSEGVRIRAGTDSTSCDTGDSASCGAEVVWLVEGYIRLYEGLDEWNLGVIYRPSSTLVVTQSTE